MIKVKLNLISPLIVGGRNLVGNFLSTKDYIPGDVIRAAIAREILRNCPLYDVDKPDKDGRYNWIYIRDDEKCSRCKYKDWCRNFSNIRFYNFYYDGARPFPLSAMKCKYHNDHGLVDVLFDKKDKCPRCEERIEFATGYYKDGKMVDVPKRLFTRTAIDPYTKTARDGGLYSILAIEEGSTFEGYVDGTNELEEFKMLRIGADTSSGFGKCEIEICSEGARNEVDLIERIEKLNKIVGKRQYGGKTYKSLITLDFYSDMIPDIDYNIPLKTTDDYKELWKKILNLGFDYDVIKVYSESNLYRGYDTSKPVEDMRESPSVYIEKGSVVLIGTDENIDDIKDKLYSVEKSGIGQNTANGYGYVKICDEIRLNGGN